MAGNGTPRTTKRAQSSNGSAPKRVVGKPFKKGQSGNPGGKPRGLAVAARAAITEEELCDFWRDVMFSPKCSEAARMRASENLAERGWGKAPSHAPLEGTNPLGLGKVEEAIVSALDDLAPRREAQAARRGEIPAVADPSSAGADTA